VTGELALLDLVGADERIERSGLARGDLLGDGGGGRQGQG
jgi:hypothetical protein